MAAPALADARDADGLTPLHLAVVHGNVPLVQTLLAAGADVNARDDEHHTVVHWATGETSLLFTHHKQKKKLHLCRWLYAHAKAYIYKYNKRMSEQKLPQK